MKVNFFKTAILLAAMTVGLSSNGFAQTRAQAEQQMAATADNAAKLHSSGAMTAPQGVIQPQHAPAASGPVTFDFEGGFPYGTTFVNGDCFWMIGDSASAFATYMIIPNHHGYFAYVNDDKCDGNMYDVWLKLPPVSFAGVSSPTLKFDNYRYRLDSDTFRIKVSTDAINWTTVKTYTTITGDETLNGVQDSNEDWGDEDLPENWWVRNVVDLSAYANQSQVYIAFHYSDGGEWAYGWAVDDIIISQACAAPYDLAATVSGTSATVSWNTNGGSNFEVKYGYAGKRFEDLTIHNTTGSSFTINDIVPSSTYWVYVRQNCGSSQSTWTGPVWIKTSSGTVNTPHWFESFEVSAKSIPDQVLGSPWTNTDNDGDGKKWMNCLWAPHGGYNSASSQSWDGNVLTPDNYLISPKITIPENASSATLKYWVAAQDKSYNEEHYEVKISTTNTGVGSFTSIHSETMADSTWHERTHDLSSYKGNDIYIAFVHNQCTDMFRIKIDDVSVDVTGGGSGGLTVTALTPVNGATDVGINTEVSVAFSENITAGNLSGITVNGQPAYPSVSGNKLIINHADFNPNTFYMVNVPAGAVSGYSEAVTWSFTTGSGTTALEVSSLTPANGAINVYLNNEVSIAFNQNITAGNLGGITVNGQPAYPSISGNKLIINHTDFTPNSFYFVNVPAGTVSGYEEVVSWSFTTGTETGISDISEERIAVYPNPTTGQLTITMGHAPLSNIVENVAVYDMTGRNVGANLRVRPDANETTTVSERSRTIDISHLPTGVYFLRIETETGTVTQKVMKQ